MNIAIISKDTNKRYAAEKIENMVIDKEGHIGDIYTKNTLPFLDRTLYCIEIEWENPKLGSSTYYQRIENLVLKRKDEENGLIVYSFAPAKLIEEDLQFDIVDTWNSVQDNEMCIQIVKHNCVNNTKKGIILKFNPDLLKVITEGAPYKIYKIN